MASVDEIRPAVEATLSGMGLELHALKFFSAGSRSVLRVFVDKDGGVTIADCEAASNRISAVLDVEGFSVGAYTLEVSSPGADRPLVTEKDYLRARGRVVRLEMRQGVDNKKTLTGSVLSCAGGAVTIDAGGAAITVPLSDIANGKLELQFK